MKDKKKIRSQTSIDALAVGTSFKAKQQAFAKALINPSLTSWLFKTSSLKRPRICISADMSISLNVVSEAAAFCDSFKRSAIRRRIRDILTRVSLRLPGTLGDSAAALSASLSFLGFEDSVFFGGAGFGGSGFGSGDGSLVLLSYINVSSFLERHGAFTNLWTGGFR